MSENFSFQILSNLLVEKTASVPQSVTESSGITFKKRKLAEVGDVNGDVLDSNSLAGVDDVANSSLPIDEREQQIFNSLPRISHEENDGNNICQFCAKKYQSFKALNDHKRLTHPQTYFACPNVECRSSGGQKMFDCVREVVAHYIREHTDKIDGKIVCGISGCISCLSEQKSFNKHIKNYHPDDEAFYQIAAKFYAVCQSNHIYQRSARVSESRKKK